MAVYTKLEKRDIKNILKEYDLKLIQFKPEKGGASNTNYLLKTNKGKMMLSVAEDFSEKEAKLWAKKLNWLTKNGFRTTTLIKTKKGKLITAFNKKPVLLKKYLSGYVLTEASLKNYREIGAGLAKLHLIPVPKFLRKQFFFDNPLYVEVIGKNIDIKYERWLEKRLEHFDKNLPENLPKGLIHSDLFLDNVLFKNGHFKTILDFEDAGHYYFVFDLGTTIVGSCFDGEQLNFKKAKALLKGYQTVRKLKKKEIKALQIYTEYAGVMWSSWRIWKYHIKEPGHERAGSHRTMMRMAKSVQKMKKKKFFKRLGLRKFH